MYKDRFVVTMFESLVPENVTVEAEYVGLVLSIDGHQHPLLQDFPYQPREVPPAEFMDLRSQLISGKFCIPICLSHCPS